MSERAARWEPRPLTVCGKTLYGHEDVSGHEFTRAVSRSECIGLLAPAKCNGSQERPFSAASLALAPVSRRIFTQACVMSRASTPLPLLFSPIMTRVRAREERPDRLVSCTPLLGAPDILGGAIVIYAGINK